MLGLQGAGKSTFVHVINTGSFNDSLMPTVGFNMQKVQRGAVTIKVWDMVTIHQQNTILTLHSQTIDRLCSIHLHHSLNNIVCCLKWPLISPIRVGKRSFARCGSATAAVCSA